MREFLAEGSPIVEAAGAWRGTQTRIREFLNCKEPQTPCRIVDLATVERHLFELRMALPSAELVHAVRCGQAAGVLGSAARLGCRFDAATPGDVDLCLLNGIAPTALSYTGTEDLADVSDRGVRLFGVDGEQGLDALAALAPGAAVYCRVPAPGPNDCGAVLDVAVEVLSTARWLGLVPYGISFRIGASLAELVGVPASWRDHLLVCAAGIQEAFGERGDLRLLVEPGDSVVADASVVIGELGAGPLPTYCV
ncbi:hypothetical protein [Kutzneria albida]|uniref:Orn/DAP/Arg decarboxylase 2 N-terminal domain-containing protein n=1 Tax=Kutzneria albida DSM 43870 TaxID=1449976 RepID=W5W961_9PSEU|nr:hypothetical protein [Kutzneria albida]AHH94719.1 hypothetical protein KALB_1346 [Kutzneria albida DSM 43870]